MTVTAIITPKELERQAALCLGNKAFIIMLAVNPGALGIGSTWAEWAAEEISGGGYARVTGTTGAGSYNSTSGRFEIPPITATFTGSGVGFLYDTVIVRIDGATYPHSVWTESPSIALAAGQPQRYVIALSQND